MNEHFFGILDPFGGLGHGADGVTDGRQNGNTIRQLFGAPGFLGKVVLRAGKVLKIGLVCVGGFGVFGKFTLKLFDGQKAINEV